MVYEVVSCLTLMAWLGAFARVSCFSLSPITAKCRIGPRIRLEANTIQTSGEEQSLELSRRLQRELDSLQKNSSCSFEEARQMLFRMRLPTLGLNLTYVGPSRVAGRGLFALEAVPKGTILTCYPGDALILRSCIAPNDENFEQDTFLDDDEAFSETLVWGEHVTTNQEQGGIDNLVANPEYVLQTPVEDWSIVALAHWDNDPCYLGHFANDGASAPTCPAELSTYMIDSIEQNNAMHRDVLNCHMVTIATKDITVGEEIFVTYGPDYWMEHEGFLEKGRGIETYAGKGLSSGKGFG